MMRHAKTCLWAYACIKGPDQTALPCSLIRAFTKCYQNHLFCLLIFEKFPFSQITSFQSLIPISETIFNSSLGTLIRNCWAADPNALLNLYLLPDRCFFFFFFFFFSISERGIITRGKVWAIRRVRQYIDLFRLQKLYYQCLDVVSHICS